MRERIRENFWPWSGGLLFGLGSLAEYLDGHWLMAVVFVAIGSAIAFHRER